LLPPIGSAWATLLGGLDRLAVEDRHARLGFLADGLAHVGLQSLVDAVPSAVLLPEAEGVEDDVVG